MVAIVKHYWPSQQDHRGVWALAWPLILSNITVPLLGLVDTAVIGHLDDSQHLAGVAAGATLFTFLYWSFGFLRMGTTGLTAKAVGANAADRNATLLFQAMLLAALIGLFLWLFQTPLISLGFWLLGPTEAVLTSAQSYAQIRIWGAPATLINYALIGWFVGNQNTRIPLLLLVVSNLSNMLLDVVAVYLLDMRADGIALATVISDYLTLGLGLWIARSQLARIGGVVAAESLRRWQHYKALLVVNRQLFVRTAVLLFATSFFTAQGARQGADILAANAVLMSFVMLVSYALDGFAHAVEALAGKALGAQDTDSFYRQTGSAAIWSLISAGIAVLVFMLAGEWIISLLTSIEAVQQLAAIYLPWLIWLPLVAVWSYLLDGVFIGATQTRVMQNAMLITVFLVYLPVWWLTQSMGNHGLWLALWSFYAARAVTSGWWFWRLSSKAGWL